MRALYSLFLLVCFECMTISFWLNEKSQEKSLRKCDLAVIGAGLTGASTAYFARRIVCHFLACVRNREFGSADFRILFSLRQVFEISVVRAVLIYRYGINNR